MTKNTSKNTGLKPKERPLVKRGKKPVANQWQSTPQQTQFMEFWLDTESSTFGNAYKSAISAGYSVHYASQIASPSVNLKWLTEYKRRLNLTDEHIKQGIYSIATRKLNLNESRSPLDTRLKAYEVLAKVAGLIDNKGQTTNVIVQPILGGKSAQSLKKVENTVVIDTQDTDDTTEQISD